MKKQILGILVIIITGLFYAFSSQEYTVDEARFVIHISDPSRGNLKLYWRDENENLISSIEDLRKHVGKKNENLLFAMNGGMYNKDQSPQGLYIENGKVLQKMDRTRNGYGNFYLQPNGIFYITKSGSAYVKQTTDFESSQDIEYATQSGPMLLIDGSYHPKLIKGSKNLHIRNAVGILPEGKILFAMSKEKMNFFDLATLFKQKGCINALYLDGFVSRTYLPSSDWIQLDGHFGVIIGESK